MAVTKLFRCPACGNRFEARVAMIDTTAACKCGKGVAHVVIQPVKLRGSRATEAKGRS